MSRLFAIGGWVFSQGNEQGLHIFKDGTEVQHLWPNIRIGSQYYDPDYKVDYICEEHEDVELYGEKSGGFLTAVRLTDGQILSRTRTYGIDPTFCAMSPDKKYIVVAHHGGPSIDSGDAEGCPVNLYKVNEDGSIGDRVDRMLIHGGEKKAQLHSIYLAPTGSFYLINECGQDKVLTMVIENERMRLVDNEEVPNKYCPRYGVWNKNLPLYYGNNELAPYLTTYEYKPDGSIKRVKDLCLLVGDEITPEKPLMQADMLMHPNGKYIYTLIRRIQRLVVIEVGEDGDTKVIQSVDNGSPMTRGLAMTEDGKSLYVCNADISEIWRFDVAEDGTVKDSGEHQYLKNCGNMIIVEE